LEDDHWRQQQSPQPELSEQAAIWEVEIIEEFCAVSHIQQVGKKRFANLL
jgi:hypothetical protein